MRSAASILITAAGLWWAVAPAATNDPMRPVPRPGTVTAPETRPAPPPRRDWVLTSTLVGEQRRVAVINDRLVGIGDSVLGAEVIDIDARSARLRYAGEVLELQLGRQPVDKQPDGRTRHGAGQ